jgi:hypothetical protein
MMYQEKMIVVVKVNGRILREFNNDSSESSVLLPFNSEYSIFVKNMESRPARLKVWIDGEDVLSGNAIIIPAGKEHELHGFMNSGGKVTNSFKFIQKTDKIVDYRGDRIDDGILRIEWQFKKQQPIKVDIHETHHHWDHVHYYPKPYWNPWWSYPHWTWSGPVYGSSSGNVKGLSGDVQVFNCVNSTTSFKDDLSTPTCNIDVPMASPAPDEGITVHGEALDQQYHTGYIGAIEPNKHVMIIRLRGTSKVAGERIVTPVEVRTKIQCPTCGVVAKSGTKYCSNCGTNIVVV